MGWTLGEIMAGSQAVKALKSGATPGDIAFSKLSGIDPNDVHALRNFTLRSRLLMITRCPPLAALAWHGTLQPKTYAASKIKAKSSDATGVAIDANKRMYVSDYDLMSVWQVAESGECRKIAVTGADPNRTSPMSKEATHLLRAINAMLVSKFQHGCQDDWDNPDNRGVKQDDRFAVFKRGKAIYIPNPNEMVQFYRKHRLDWPYDDNGHYKLSWGVIGLA